MLSRTVRPLLLAGFTLFTLWLAWVGWLDSDDHRHVDGGLGWMREFPYLPQSHGEFRHLVTIPIGMAFRLFGVSEATLIAPNLLYYFATLILTYFWVGKTLGQRTNVLALLIMVSLPVFAIQATVVFSDITEIFFVVLSLWLFLMARNRTDKHNLLLLSGVAAGCAWLTRETTIALLITYGIVWLTGKFVPRRQYLYMAIGFLVVLLAEAAFMYYMTGNPLHRYTEILSARQGFRYRGAVEGDVFDGIGNVHVSRWLDPLLALFVNHEFGVIYFLFLPALVWLWRNPQLPSEVLSIARLLSILGGVWFVAVAVMLANMHPRYFTVTTYAAAIICALWIVHGVFPKRRRLAVALSVALVGGGLLSIYVDNRSPLFGERALKELVQSQSGIVHTDPETARRAGFLLWIDGLEKQVSADAPPAGSLFYHNPNRERDQRSKRLDLTKYSPQPGWTRVWERTEPPRLLGLLLQKLGVADKLPTGLYRRLSQPNRPVAAYRVTDGRP